MRSSAVAPAFALLAASAVQTVHGHIVRGVNLGGWLVTEPWMTPSIFTSTNTTCEWDLCNALGKEQCLSTLNDHWDSFYTRDDFVDIKNAGLTAVRIPFGYWSVNLTDYEPYVAGAYPYLVRAVEWAGELGLNVFIDMHGAPGSQNGWEESGLVGALEFFSNSSNAERTINVLTNLTQEFKQDIYKGVVTNIELLNEPVIGFSTLDDFYVLAADSVAAGNSSGINITISDGFFEPHTWENYNPWAPDASKPAEFLTVDTHQFWGFAPLDAYDKEQVLASVCQFGQEQLRADPTLGIPPTLVGEWSLDTGVTNNSTSDTYYDVEKRTWFRTLFEAQNAAFTPNSTDQSSIGWYFWAWKTEYNIDAWSYSKGLQEQYIPSNVSDPSTYAFPIGDDGCIDATYNYTAPVLGATSTSSASGTATSTGKASSTSTSLSGANSSNKSSSATRFATASWFAPRHVLQFTVAIAVPALLA